MPLDRATADRLIKLLGLTGSAFDGEALAAARKANDTIKAAGLSWAEVIGTGQDDAAFWMVPEWREPTDWRDAVRICLELPGAPLSDWDAAFLRGIATKAALSPKQAAQLARIVAACRGYAQMAA